MAKAIFDIFLDAIKEATKLEDIEGLTSPLQFRGEINVAADFPTLAVTIEGHLFRVKATVTDNDGTKTNTGQSFIDGDEIAWNGTNWTNLGNANDPSPPTGAAGGELGGTYPNPTVNDGADSTAIHDNIAAEINAVTEKGVPVGTDLILIEDSADSNNKKRIQLVNLPAATPAAHNLGGAQHNADTLANLNSKVSDATLIDTGDSRLSDARTPTAHNLGGAEHSADTLANLNTKISDANLDDSSSTRTPAAHNLGGAEHSADTLANLNAKVSDANLIDTGDSRLSDARTPTVHNLGGAEHSADTLANLNSKVSDATLIDAADSRIPSQDENNALAGTDGVPSSTNKYVTNSDARNSDARTPTAHTHAAADVNSGTFVDARIAESNVTQHEAAIDHDALTNFAIGEHRAINDAGSSTTDLFSASKILADIAAVLAGIDIKEGVDTTTKGVGNITLSGEQTLNGLLTSASRVLVTDQTTPADNGIYVSAAGAWSRATDADEDAEVTNGNTLSVLNSGSTKFKFKYLLVTSDPIVVGTTGQTWEEHKDIDFGTTTGTATEGNDSRVPIQDENDALVGTNGTPSTTNKYVTNSDARNSDARTPTAHDLAGAEHTADTLANLNSKVSDATLIDTGDSRLSDSRIPTGVAGGDLGGTYPNPTVDDGADSTAIHDNVSAEISALTEKVTPVNADFVIIEDSADSNNKKKAQLGNLPAGATLLTTLSSASSTDTTTLGVADVYRMTASNTTLTIQTADITEGRVFHIRGIIASDGSPVTIATQGSETIDGSTNDIELTTNHDSVTLYATGGNLESLQ